MKKIFMAIVLCLVCTVSFGQDRVNRVNPIYESEGYVLKDIIGWGYNEQLGQWRGYPNVIWTLTKEFNRSIEEISKRYNVYDLQFKTINLNNTFYYVLISTEYTGRWKYEYICEDWIWWKYKRITLLSEEEFNKLHNLSNKPITIQGRYTKINQYDSDQNEINHILKEINKSQYLIDDYYITIYQATDGSIRFLMSSILPYRKNHLDIDNKYFEITEEDYLKFINIQ